MEMSINSSSNTMVKGVPDAYILYSQQCGSQVPNTRIPHTTFVCAKLFGLQGERIDDIHTRTRNPPTYFAGLILSLASIGPARILYSASGPIDREGGGSGTRAHMYIHTYTYTYI